MAVFVPPDKLCVAEAVVPIEPAVFVVVAEGRLVVFVVDAVLTVMVAVSVGVDVSVEGTVKPDVAGVSDAVVRGSETTPSSRR